MRRTQGATPRYYYAFIHTYGQNAVDSDGDPIGAIYAFPSLRQRDRYVDEAQEDQPYITNAGYTEEISANDPYVRRMLRLNRLWGAPTIAFIEREDEDA